MLVKIALGLDHLFENNFVPFGNDSVLITTVGFRKLQRKSLTACN
jgi:hypothetical protein